MATQLPHHRAGGHSSSLQLRALVVTIAAVAFCTNAEFGLDEYHYESSPYVPHPVVEYETQLFWYRATNAPHPSMPNITLVSHATLDRLPAVQRVCRTFRGPMSISVFVRPLVDDIDRVMSAFLADECVAKHADLHLVREKTHVYDADLAARGEKGKDMMTHYPFNVQRNAALDGCVGDLALLMDIDFHLMPALESASDTAELRLRRVHRAAVEHVSSSWSFPVGQDRADPDAMVFVVAAVETVSTSVPVPESKELLAIRIEAQTICPFYGHSCQVCHRPTNIRQFLETSQPYLVDYVEGFEPYVIVNRSARVFVSQMKSWYGLPRYNESFIGRGYSKMSWFYELSVQRRVFVVLPDVFLVHAGRGNVFKMETLEWRLAKRQEAVDDEVRAYYIRQVQNRAAYDDFMARTLTAYGVAPLPKQPAHQPPHTKQNTAKRDDRGSPRKAGVGAERETLSEGAVLATARGSTPGAPRLVVDPLLWNATRGLRWSALSTQVLGTQSSCLARRRARPLSADDEAKLSSAVNWACKRMDCTELMTPWEIPKAVQRPHPLRYYPKDVLLEADWVFDRWFHRAVEVEGADPAVACDFTGLADIVSQPDVVFQLEPHQASSIWVERSPPVLEVKRWNFVGCTLNPFVCVTRSQLRRLVDEICEGVAIDSADAAPREATDAITGHCEHLFMHVDPLVRDELWMRAAVALNAHHLIFSSSGQQATCTSRFGSVAAWTVLPDAVIRGEETEQE